MGWLARVAAMVTLAMVLGACAFERPTYEAVFEAVFPATETHPRALPVRLHDRAGIVREIRVHPLAAEWWQDWSEVATNPDGQADRALISWTGGACEDATVMDFRADGQGYLLAITLEDGFFGASCPAVGIPRQILITFDHSVDATTIRIERA